MWFFNTPNIVYGDDALEHLETIQGTRAVIVTDKTLHALGYAGRVQTHLQRAGMDVMIFDEIEPEPALQTVQRGARILADYEPDWIVGLGGGSCMDAAAAMWALYERPDLQADEISPMLPLNLRRKARLITIPTTSGTGSECTWIVVLSEPETKRKLVLGSFELIADYAIVDPSLVMDMPAQLAADSGVDALAQAIESYTSRWRNEFADGLCLQAIRMIFQYLPRSVKNGRRDPEAREKMHYAATIAGMAMSNSQAALSHALGHPLGAYFKIPHGRTIGVFLPATIEYGLPVSGERYAEIARFLGLPAASAAEGTASLVQAIREMLVELGQPTCVAELGIDRESYEAAIPTMIESGEGDAAASSPRIPSEEEHAHLFRCAYEGIPVDF